MAGECVKEPLWFEIYPDVPRPSAGKERIAEAAAYLATKPLTCDKLQMNPTACHGCRDNPREQQNAAGERLIGDYHAELDYVTELHDAVRMGLVRDLGEIGAEEYELLRIYWNAVERQKAKAITVEPNA